MYVIQEYTHGIGEDDVHEHSEEGPRKACWEPILALAFRWRSSLIINIMMNSLYDGLVLRSIGRGHDLRKARRIDGEVQDRGSKSHSLAAVRIQTKDSNLKYRRLHHEISTRVILVTRCHFATERREDLVTKIDWDVAQAAQFVNVVTLQDEVQCAGGLHVPISNRRG